MDRICFTTNPNFFSQRHWWLWRSDECFDFQDELFNFEQILRMSQDNWIPKKFILEVNMLSK